MLTTVDKGGGEGFQRVPNQPYAFSGRSTVCVLGTYVYRFVVTSNHLRVVQCAVDVCLPAIAVEAP